MSRASWLGLGVAAAVLYPIFVGAGAGLKLPIIRSTDAPTSDFPVNTFTTGTQKFAAVAMDADGDMVVVWQSDGQDGGGYGIYAQRYGADGSSRGNEFQVASTTSYDQSLPAVAMDADGDFVVAWESLGQDMAGDSGIFARKFAADGTPQGAEFQVNTFEPFGQQQPAVAMDASGNFVVVWHGQDYADVSFDVFGQRYAASGTPQGGEFIVNTYTTSAQKFPAVAMDTDGDFVVAWSSYQDGDQTGVYAQRYTSAGAPAGAEFVVNTFTTGFQDFPAVAADAAGNFVVAWYSNPWTSGSEGEIVARRFSSTGVAASGEFHVNTTMANFQTFPRVAMDADGDFVVVWDSDVDPSDVNIYGQRYTSGGVTNGGEIEINTTRPGLQRRARVAASATGDFIIAWDGQDGSDFGVIGRGYSDNAGNNANNNDDGGGGGGPMPLSIALMPALLLMRHLARSDRPKS